VLKIPVLCHSEVTRGDWRIRGVGRIRHKATAATGKNSLLTSHSQMLSFNKLERNPDSSGLHLTTTNSIKTCVINFI